MGGCIFAFVLFVVLPMLLLAGCALILAAAPES